MSDQTTDQRLLRAGEVAAILGVSKTQAYRLMEKAIPTVRFLGAVRVAKSDLDKFIEQHRRTHNGQAS